MRNRAIRNDLRSLFRVKVNIKVTYMKTTKKKKKKF